ncbi:MAG: LCP family protein [Acidimicrobiia bacterium]|nr:LCP family protein [Acidimicrobiia bacterium]
MAPRETPANPTPLSAAFWSAVFPGLGHVKTNPPRAWFVMLFSLTSAVAVLSWLATRDRSELLSWSVNPRWLIGLIVISLATMMWRIWATIDAAQAAGIAETRPSRRTLVGLAIIVVLETAPHAVVADLAWQQHQTVTQLFAMEATVTARPTPLSNPAEAAATSNPTGSPDEHAERRITSAVVDGDDLGDPDGLEVGAGVPAGPSLSPDTTTAPPTTVATTATWPEPPATWDGERRLSIVMLGSDGGYDRVGIRTDTIIVISIDVATGDAVTFSVPRNWRNIPFPAGTPAAATFPGGNPDIANTVYAIGLRNPGLFPGAAFPGGAAVKQAMAQTLGIPIQFFVMVDMTAVVETIDLFGGIDLTVTEYINDRIRPIEEGGPWLDITTQPGDYHFDGLTTLAYVRSRVQSWDYSRMARQRCVVGALIDQVGPLELLAKFGPFSDIVANHVVTDIPLDRAGELIGIAARLDLDRMRTVNFVPPEFPEGPVPLTKVRNTVSTALASEAPTGPSQSLTDACDGR